MWEDHINSKGWKAYPNSGQHFTNDSPFLTLANQLNNNAFYQAASMHDHFQVYLMYMPPNWKSTDSEWVPLKYMEWHTDGDSTSANVTSQTLFDPITFTSLTCLPNHVLAPMGVMRIIPPTDTTGHPLWKTVVTPGIKDTFNLR